MAFDPLTGVLEFGSKVIDKIFPDKNEAAKAKARLFELQQRGELAELTAAVRIITAELNGNWLQRSWRPILMLSIVAILVNNYILVPYLQLFGLSAVMLELPDKLWNLLTLGVGGYVVGRSGEKIAREWKK